MIDSQIGKVKFGQTLKAGNKQAGLDGPCVITYHPDFKAKYGKDRTPIVSG